MPRRLYTRWTRRLAALLPLALLAGCADETALDEEARIGAEYAAQIARQVRFVRDPVAERALDRLGHELAQKADSTGRRYTFYLVDSPEVNAFSIPGGYIYVDAGLVDLADHLSELAGVLAHEIGHVTRRHGMLALERERDANLLLRAVYTVLGRDPGALEQVAIRGGSAAILSKYSRDAERQADQEAIETLVAAGIDPDGLPEFFLALLRQQRDEPDMLDEWFGSHPTSAERVENTRLMIDSLGVDTGRLLRDTPSYQRFRDRLVGPAR